MRQFVKLLLLALLIWLVVTWAAKAQPEQPAEPDTVPWPIPDVRIVEPTYEGRTAREWHGRLVAERARFRRVLRAVIYSPVYGTSTLEKALLCIHFNPRVGHGEGPWDANTGNGYQGGLQMDRSFQRTYGGWALAAFGPANRWPVAVQLAVGIRAVVSGRGFYPWPNTARACGLIR